MMRYAPALAILPVCAFAAGTDPEPPKPTETTERCADGQVWDAGTSACVDAQDSRLDDDDRLRAARELAYAGRPRDALRVLAAVSAGEDPDVLALRGFATRRAGDWAGAIRLYRAALATEPDHWQTLSYMGQALAQRGDRRGAADHLERIRASGGRGSWPEISLARMLRTGRSSDY